MTNYIQKTIQTHLFEHPLYNWTDNTDEHMNVLVIGSGDYSSAFVDLCLQVGQMLNKALTIHWCVSGENDKDEYIEKRPALEEFISIDNEVIDDPFAHVFFHDFGDYTNPFSEECRYILIATNDDELNHETAELFKIAATGSEKRIVSFLADQQIKTFLTDTENPKESKEVIYANNLIQSEKELQRMAFNTHRIWEGKGNHDYELSKKRFEQSYNYNSSTSFVLSIPYKLQSIGIDSDDCYVAAKLFCDEVMNNTNSNLINELALLEHKRWVMEKITKGARRLVDKNGRPEYTSCIARTSIKKEDDEGNLIMHPCIVRSTASNPLGSNDGSVDYKLWDNKKINQLDLDELDMVSIELHRSMKKYAASIRDNHPQLDDLIDQIKKYFIYFDDYTKRNADRYLFCIRNILDYHVPYATQFETYEKMLIRGISTEDLLLEIKQILQQIKSILFPIIESIQYRNYKKYDIELIKEIPYILTNKNDVHICMPIGEPTSILCNNNEYFKSVASATALYAKKLTFLIDTEGRLDIDILYSKLKAIDFYFSYRSISVAIDIIVLTKKTADSDLCTTLNDMLNKCCDERFISSFRFTTYQSSEDFVAKTKQAVEESNADYYDGSTVLTISAYTNGKIVDAVSEVIPYFEFDSNNALFTNCVSCDYLSYNRPSSFIQVEDMFALMNACDLEFNYPDLADDYRELWSVFSGEVIGEKNFPLCAKCWNLTCNILSTGGSSCKKIADLKIPTKNAREKEIVIKMLRALNRLGYIKNLSINREKGNISASIIKKAPFSKGGDLLETYVYYEACKTEWFDDVQSGYKFKWEYDNVQNELDCVLTKGYRSILVECKSITVNNFKDENVYEKLNSIADHFGIDYKKVLIWLTNTNHPGYKTYISRGKQLGIITISNKNDMKNIGEKLKEIMLM